MGWVGGWGAGMQTHRGVGGLTGTSLLPQLPFISVVTRAPIAGGCEGEEGLASRRPEARADEW